MKIITAFLLTSVFAFANATTLHWRGADNSQGSGFEDSSFNYDSSRTFCYVGNPRDVCSIINIAAEQMQKIYANGAHDTIDLTSCTQYSDIVTTHYKLRDDYNVRDIEVTRVISRCL